jgi:hypothetical protein
VFSQTLPDLIRVSVNSASASGCSLAEVFIAGTGTERRAICADMRKCASFIAGSSQASEDPTTAILPSAWRQTTALGLYFVNTKKCAIEVFGGCCTASFVHDTTSIICPCLLRRGFSFWLDVRSI